ncbi:hypothetical protein EJ08DRAFT_667012 [Tothia fuscella]|uniref:Non-ribosomal peptide synthetase n=1 Tax=Tothia fuscella TaxID=1048955 RepID=A0A9P4P531_9PEZI|nr:hypothetical protein EJ08DRAFT_667012 [Tothia fuscella]
MPLPVTAQPSSDSQVGWVRRRYQETRWKLFSAYRRLFSVVLVANLFLLAWVIWKQQWSDHNTRPQSLQANVLTAVSANILASIMTRNEHVINTWFRVFVVHISPALPLQIRRWCAKVYCYGGVHSGCGVAAAFWYLAFVVIAAYHYITNGGPAEQRLTLVLNGVIWLLLTTIIAAAHPSVRTHMHDYFEFSHRFCGWLVLIVFWIQIVTTGIHDARRRNQTVGMSLIEIPTFWMLITMSLLVMYPWIRLRRVTVEVKQLSEHAAQIDFPNGVMQPCRTIRLADRPLMETHAFATIPRPNGAPGYSVLVSKAGDWTKQIILRRPEKIWIKGAPTWGVLRVATLFKPVVIVATGSGIGPCLGLFNGFPGLPCRVVWSVKSPEETYGKEIVDAVRRADKDANIIDTNKLARGERPNMENATIAMFRESKAEAVVIISNPILTKGLVYKLECQGIPAYGPIWDS